MKQILICMIAICLVGLSIPAFAADKVSNTSDKSIASAIADDAKEVKTGTVKAVKGSKEAIAHDIREIKENVPKDLRDAKEEAIRKSREVKEAVKQEFKEIKNGLSQPLKPKSEAK